MNFEELKQLLKDHPAYRLKQVYSLIFHNLIESWQEATILPKDLKKNLGEKFSLNIEAKILEEKNTKKAAIKLPDNETVETVLLRHSNDRNTVCVSSQVGCPLGCKFCATGKMKFIRNLSYSEILTQIIFFARLLKKEKEKITNIVFMGMGEPFLNYDEVMKSISFINDKNYFNIGARKISISTVGITEGIKKLSRENLQLNLAISLHAPNDKLRSEIIPINNKYSIRKILEATSNYIEKTNRRVMIEYLLIDKVNDSPELAEELANILNKQLDKLFFVNLIKYNPTGDLMPSQKNDISKFKNILEKNNIQVVERFRFGTNINAACGQLASQIKKPLNRLTKNWL